MEQVDAPPIPGSSPPPSPPPQVSSAHRAGWFGGFKNTSGGCAWREPMMDWSLNKIMSHDVFDEEQRKAMVMAKQLDDAIEASTHPIRLPTRPMQFVKRGKDD